MFQISLVAAFIAGMVALFAPCCISYLFPAYLANIFKERKQVLLMTLIYSLGIFVVMMPIVLGAKALASFFMELHDTTYIIGGVVMMAIGVLSFLGVKMPMPNLSYKQKSGKPDFFSTFTLGIFSGITSACCAPVLIGVMTLSTFSSSMIGALAIGMSYVLGMVTPLYVASFFITKGNILNQPILKKKLFVVNLFASSFPIFVSNLVAATIFFITGLAMIVLTSMGKLSMTAEDSVTQSINQVALTVTEKTANIPGVNIVFAAVALLLVYKLFKASFNTSQTSNKHKSEKDDKPSCCQDDDSAK